MYCSQCGVEVKPEQEICIKCGVRVRQQKTKNSVVKIVVIIIGIIVGIPFSIGIIAPQFTAYHKRGYVATLNSDAKNAFVAAATILTDNPTAVVDCSMLETAGYKPSTMTSCSGQMNADSGGFKISGPSSWGLSNPAAIIRFDGYLEPAQP